MNFAYTDGNGGSATAMELATRMSPLVPAYDDDGNLMGPYSNSGPNLANSTSPLADLFRARDDFNKSMRVFGDIYLEADIIDGLTFKTSYGVSLQHFDRRQFLALNPEAAESRDTNTLIKQDQRSYEWTWSNTLTYNKTFGEHSINAVLGVEAVEGGGTGKEVQRSDYLLEDPNYYNLFNGGGEAIVNYDYEYKNSLFSYFLSANYNYKNKYFLTATFRNDTSSRFRGDNKSDFFPSFSAGWLMSGEDWFNNEGVVSRLKLKASYGELGNQDLPGSNPTVNISNLDQQFGDYVIDGSSVSQGAILSTFGNPDLKWETSVTTNFGFDLGFFQDRLTASFEYYTITTKDLIAQDFSLISTTAIDAAAPYVNLGEVENRGFDISLGYNNTWDNGLTFGVLANISSYKNEVKDLISAFQIGRNDLRGGAMTRTEVGQPISSFYGRNVIGLSDEGRFIYEDVNNDGVINDSDRKYIGSPHPDFTFGLNLNASYKGFDASLFFTGSQGNDVYNYQKIYTDFPTFRDGNRSVRVLNSWTPDNTNTNLPALGTAIVNQETDPNSFFVEDASYIRLKNLQIGYSFPSAIAEKIAMSSLRIYVVGTNLWTSTGYDGIDPEVVSYDNLTLGVDNDLYPRSKIYTLGVTLKF
jgi:TonB-linked SusC/RagA family outer membrane protein